MPITLQDHQHVDVYAIPTDQAGQPLLPLTEPVSWSSDHPDIASVVGDPGQFELGHVQAHKPGSARITARYGPFNFENADDVTVTPSPPLTLTITWGVPA